LEADTTLVDYDVLASDWLQFTNQYGFPRSAKGGNAYAGALCCVSWSKSNIWRGLRDKRR
jgi:hypothetical protein